MIEIPEFVLIALFVIIIVLSLVLYKYKDLIDELRIQADDIEAQAIRIERMATSKILTQAKYLDIMNFVRIRTQAGRVEFFYRDGWYFYSEMSNGLIVRFKDFDSFLERVDYTMNLVEKDKSLNLMTHEAFNV